MQLNAKNKRNKRKNPEQSKILFNETRDKDGRITAIGLEYEHENQTQRVYASREVILSAGKLKSSKSIRS